MYKQGEREYTLKGTFLEVKHYYGILTRKLAVMQSNALGDADLDLLEKYEADLAKFNLNILQIEEECQDFPDKADDIKSRRNYSSLIENRDACQTDFDNDRKAQRQKKLRDDLYSSVLMELITDEHFVMDILRNILNGDTGKLEYDFVFAMAVLTDFFTFVKANNPLLNAYKGNTLVN